MCRCGVAWVCVDVGVAACVSNVVAALFFLPFFLCQTIMVLAFLPFPTTTHTRHKGTRVIPPPVETLHPRPHTPTPPSHNTCNPSQIYFKRGCLEFALRDLMGRKRAFVVTDKPLYEMGLCDNVTRVLEELGMSTQVFFNVEPDPTLATVEAGLAQLKSFNPDVILALGGGYVGGVASGGV